MPPKYVDQLGQLTGETVNLSTCSGDRIINVYHAESHFVLRPNFPLYTSYPAYKTSVGRVFLSWMGDPALKWIYENNKDDISMTQEEFLAMLHQARRDGYALDDQVFSAGLRCLAAPVFLTGSKPMFAISISAPLSRMDDALYARSRELVTDFAARISHDIRPLRRGPDTHHIHRRRTGDPVRRFCLYGHLRCRRRQSSRFKLQSLPEQLSPNKKQGADELVRTLRALFSSADLVGPAERVGFLPHWIPVSSSYSFWETSPIWEWLISYSLPS